jgi:hypothetical protein
MTRPSGNKIGRPPKTSLTEIKEKRGVGRPKGDKAIMDEYKLRMLNSPKSAKVLEKVYEVALSDGHPGQMAAMKLVLDRIVPQSAFDVSKSGNGGVPQISINISSLGAPTVETVEEVTDIQSYTDVEVKEYTDTE